MKRRWVILAAGMAGLLVVAVWLPSQRSARVLTVVHALATAPSSKRAASTTAAATTVPLGYLDLIRAENPLIAATQLLELPVDLPDAAHVLLREPVYLDSAGQLWITSTGAPRAEQVLSSLGDEPQHVLGERVLFAHWVADDGGTWKPTLVVEGSAHLPQWVMTHGRSPLPLREYGWDRAFSWQDRIVVPDAHGVSVISGQPPVAAHQDFAGTPQMVLDARGLLAWVPAGPPDSIDGPPHVARFVDGAWTDAAPGAWLPRPLQLVPLLDGSVLEIARDAGGPEEDAVKLAVVPLEMTGINEQHIATLVRQLGDADPNRRQAAFDELSRSGPSVLPKLEALADTQPPETRLRLRQLLRGKVAPALGGMELLENRLSVAGRSIDGSTLLFAAAGVRVPIADGTWDEVTPAWLCLRPDGRFDRPLMQSLIADQTPAAATLSAYHDEWLITDTTGVRRWNGVTFEPLLQGGDAKFTHLLGIDRRGRWAFTVPTNPHAGTLLIDPTLADPKPKLPAWAMTINDGSVGWDDHDWPAIKRGGAWALRTDHWEPVADGDTMHEAPAVDQLAPPSTTPSTRAALLTAVDGTRYFGGNDSLEMIDGKNRATHWDLPALAVGTSITPVLLRGADGRLFLFNQPGRCSCLQPTPEKSEPFLLAATFTRGIPNGDAQRIWMDPAGRIDIVVYQHNRLVVLFPSGHIPAEIQNMMTN